MSELIFKSPRKFFENECKLGVLFISKIDEEELKLRYENSLIFICSPTKSSSMKWYIKNHLKWTLTSLFLKGTTHPTTYRAQIFPPSLSTSSGTKNWLIFIKILINIHIRHVSLNCHNSTHPMRKIWTKERCLIKQHEISH